MMRANTELIRSSAVTGLLFSVFSLGLWFFASTIGRYGNLVLVGFIFGSPIIWIFAIFRNAADFRPLVVPAVIMQYLLIGVVVGYRWPIHRNQPIIQVVRSIVVRFLWAMAVLLVIGFCVGLWALAHDS